MAAGGLLGCSWQVGSAQAWPASAADWRAGADPCFGRWHHAAEVPRRRAQPFIRLPARAEWAGKTAAEDGHGRRV